MTAPAEVSEDQLILGIVQSGFEIFIALRLFLQFRPLALGVIAEQIFQCGVFVVEGRMLVSLVIQKLGEFDFPGFLLGP